MLYKYTESDEVIATPEYCILLPFSFEYPVVHNFISTPVYEYEVDGAPHPHPTPAHNIS